eukprot:10968542-Karenia_brevis.AAC.1
MALNYTARCCPLARRDGCDGHCTMLPACTSRWLHGGLIASMPFSHAGMAALKLITSKRLPPPTLELPRTPRWPSRSRS